MAYLKIAEGCDRLVQFLHDPLDSRPPRQQADRQVVAEAEELAADGVRELVLVAQDTSYYGGTCTARPRLAEAARPAGRGRRAGVDPADVPLPDAHHRRAGRTAGAGRQGAAVPGLAASARQRRVLRRMNRRRSAGRQTEDLLDRLRGRIDGLVLRTTLIAGFPGETEEQFEELVEFVRRRRFERLGAFAYSHEPGTPAAELDGQLPEQVKQARRDRLMEVQQPIAFAWSRSQVGRRLDVLIDRDIPGEKNA